MRPRTLDEVIGQDALAGPKGVLRRLAMADELPSLLLWGPPGSGKTTLAHLLAAETGARFVALSSVGAGVAEVRAQVATAAEARGGGQRTVLFLDEIHHFSKTQQDVLLPHVEAGTITLIGATTEAPYGALVPALLSRLRLFRLAALDDAAISTLLDRTLADARGLGGRFALSDEARVRLLAFAGADARAALDLLAVAAVLATDPEAMFDADDALEPASGPIMIEMAAVDAAAQSAAQSPDPTGQLSAFIKSVRGNDPDAALFWLASMLEAGRDPREIARRLLISAGEEIGSADARALPVAAAAMVATENVGMPEIIYPLAAATVILAGLPKSQRAGQAYGAALAALAEGGQPVPAHLRTASKNYRRPNTPPDFDEDQQYLPDALRGRRFYEPVDSGLESQIKARLERLRAARKSNK
jgi:putative ATPase